MTLRIKQTLFLNLTLVLMDRALELGYELTYGDTHRSVAEATRLGKPNSVHTLSLAIDLHLFKDGKYLDKTEDHKVLGEYWETLHPLCCWGGRWEDGNHYSLEHNGVK